MTRPALSRRCTGLILALGVGGCARAQSPSTPAPVPTATSYTAEAPQISAPHDGSSVPWRSSLHDAEAEAARTGRLVFLELTIPGCHAGARLERETYPDARVQASLRAYVPVRIDASADEALANQFDFTSSPDLLLLTPDGRLLDRVSRFVPPADLVTFLEAGRLALPQPSRATIQWAASFQAAQEEAKARGRPVFLFVWNYG